MFLLGVVLFLVNGFFLINNIGEGDTGMAMVNLMGLLASIAVIGIGASENR